MLTSIGFFFWQASGDSLLRCANLPRWLLAARNQKNPLHLKHIRNVWPKGPKQSIELCICPIVWKSRDVHLMFKVHMYENLQCRFWSSIIVIYLARCAVTKLREPYGFLALYQEKKTYSFFSKTQNKYKLKLWNQNNYLRFHVLLAWYVFSLWNSSLIWIKKYILRLQRLTCLALQHALQRPEPSSAELNR